jgi:hypothetical protein
MTVAHRHERCEVILAICEYDFLLRNPGECYHE